MLEAKDLDLLDYETVIWFDKDEAGEFAVVCNGNQHWKAYGRVRVFVENKHLGWRYVGRCCKRRPT